MAYKCTNDAVQCLYRDYDMLNNMVICAYGPTCLLTNMKRVRTSKEILDDFVKSLSEEEIETLSAMQVP